MFGPRGLSSLLLVLLPVFAGIPGAERLFEITCLVVLFSVVVHGGGIALYLRRHGGAAMGAPAPGASPAPATSARDPGSGPRAREPATEAVVPERISIGEMQARQRAGEPVILADVRTERSYRDDGDIAVGAIRLPPDDAVRLAREKRLDQHATVVLYCA